MSKNINQYQKGRTTLIQPLHANIGHTFHVFNKRLRFRTELSGGTSVFKQRISNNDPRYDIRHDYSYSKTFFTIHTKLGLALATGKKSVLELYANLPILERRIALTGLGIGYSRKLYK